MVFIYHSAITVRYDRGCKREAEGVMWSKKTIWFWISGLAMSSLGGLFGISVYRNTSFIDKGAVRISMKCTAQIFERENQAKKTEEEAEGEKETTKQWTEICLDLYETAKREHRLTDLETIRSIVNRFGEWGYTAVDSENQINMTEADQMAGFCAAVCAGKDAELTLIEVTGDGFGSYELRTEAGEVDVSKRWYQYENGEIRQVSQSRYQAEGWQNTEDGYVMFSGNWFSEAEYVLTCSEAKEYKAFRAQPLDEACRRLNREYLMPVGYRYNNMFLTDWEEGEFGDLNFYDLFDLFYLSGNGKPVPYESGKGIPKDVFEGMIMSYFRIDSKTLQAETAYCAEEETYFYKPRGFSEAEYPAWPYPEVVGYTENADGTITLLVHAVFPYGGNSSVYAHKVTVRPLKDGGVQYVSNTVIPSEENGEFTWHTPRSDFFR